MSYCSKHEHCCIYLAGWMESDWCPGCRLAFAAHWRFCCDEGASEESAREAFEADCEMRWGSAPVPVPPWEQPPSAPQLVSQLLMPWSEEPASGEQIREALGRVADGVAWSLEQLAPSVN